MGMIKNPIMPGFYPDPSVCAADVMGEDGQKKRKYYLVNSTFSYAPGVPIFESEDLCNWKQIGNVLSRESQLNLEGAGMSRGIYAPCIRYHKGMFYMITTNVSGGGNFYVTAKDPAGEWSEPVYLPTAEGIDPSLFFDGDTCYYVGQRNKKDAKYFGDCEIWLQELDLESGKLVDEVYSLWDGAMKNAVWPEGPHIYKINDFYYVLIAESGTAYEHSICVARSKELFGPYEPCRRNPIFTHRHLGHNVAVQNAGHGELVEDENGEWYIFMLATRPVNGCAPLGRETFVAKVEWEEDWPVINPGIGMLREWQQIGPDAEESTDSRLHTDEKTTSDFLWTEPLDQRCLFFRYPKKKYYSVVKDGEKNAVQLELADEDFAGNGSPAYIGVRVTDYHFALHTGLDYVAESEGEAGLVYLYDENNYTKWVIEKKEDGKKYLRLVFVEDARECELIKKEIDAQTGELELRLDELQLTAYFNGEQMGNAIDASLMTSEKKGGFVGCTMGIYASGKGVCDVTAAEKGYVLFRDTKIMTGR